MIKTTTIGEIAPITKEELSDRLNELQKLYTEDKFLSKVRIEVLEATIEMLIHSMNETDNYSAMHNAKILARFVLDQ